MKLGQHLTIFFLLNAFFFTLFSSLTAQCDIADKCGDIQPSGGLAPSSPTFFCEGEVVQLVNTSDPDLVDQSIVCWGDGLCDTLVGTPNVSHIYDFPEDTCLTNNNSLTLPITLTVINVCSEGVSRNCLIVFVKIRVNPVAIIGDLNDICTGQEANLVNLSCENGDTTEYTWVVPEQPPLFDLEPTVPLTERGSIPITLIARNQCGADTTKSPIRVRGEPEAEADFIIQDTSACYPDSVQFNNNSFDATQYQWTVDTEGAFDYVDSTTRFSRLPVVLFREPDTFRVQLLAKNICGEDTTSFQVAIHDYPTVELPPSISTCGSLVYTPEVTYGGAIDSVSWHFSGGNPERTTAFQPSGIEFDSAGSFLATVVVSGPCGMDSSSQMIEIIAHAEPELQFSGPICRSSDPIRLNVESIEGVFSGEAVSSNGWFYPDQAVEGSNTVTYTFGAKDCETSVDFTIEVLPAQTVELLQDISICKDAAPFELEFSPKGGTWFGPGVVDSILGIFDPSSAFLDTNQLAYHFKDTTSNCLAILNMAIDVNPAAEIEFFTELDICANENSIDLLNLVVETPPTTGTFSWEGANIDETGHYHSSVVGEGFDTLVVTYSTADGCSTTSPIYLTVTPLTFPEPIADTVVCEGLETLTLQGIPDYGVWRGESITEQGVILLSDLEAETYTYIYILHPNTTCESRDTMTVDIKEASVDPGMDIEVCETDSIIQLPAASPSTGYWSGPIQVVNGTINISLLTTNQSYFRFIDPTLPEGCNSDSILLTIRPLPRVDFSMDSVVCQSTMINFENNTTGADVFIWNRNQPNESNSFTPTYMYEESGTYNISLEAGLVRPQSGDSFCSNRLEKEIRVLAPPQEVAFSIPFNEDCGPIELSIENQSIGDSLLYLWNLGNGDSSTMYQPERAFYLAGVEDTSYIISLTVHNICTTQTVTHSLRVLASPVADYGITFDSPCSGDTLQINNTSTGSPSSSHWYINDSLKWHTFTPPLLFPLTGDTPDTLQIRLVSQNACGIDSIQKKVVVHPTNVTALPQLSAEEICLGDSIRLESFSTPGAPIRWVLSDGNSYNSKVVEHEFLEAGPQQIILYAEGCGYDSFNVNINVLPLPSLSLTMGPTTCAGMDTPFRVDTDATGHRLSFGDSIFTNRTHGSHTYIDSGDYSLRLEATSSLGCQQSLQQSITVLPKPEAAAIFPDSVCNKELILFEAAVTGTYGCTWEFGDGNKDEGCDVTHPYDTAGWLSPQLVITTAEGCTDTIREPIYVRAGPEIDFTANIIEDCSPGLVEFTNLSQNATAFIWSFGDNHSSHQTSPTHRFEMGGVYQVSLEATLDGICKDTKTMPVEIFETPAPELQLQANCTIAEGSNLSILAPSETFATLSGLNYYQEGNLHLNLAAGVYRLFIESVNGCFYEEDLNILSPNELFIAITKDTFKIEQGEIVPLQVSSNQIDVNYSWSPEKWLMPNNSANVEAQPLRSITYIVSATNAAGCVKHDTVWIDVDINRKFGLYIPNAFTPNGDGNNDEFRIRINNPAIHKINFFRIYDKWGEVVFEAQDCASHSRLCYWDGTFRGEKAEQNTYVYHAQVEFLDGFVLNLKDNVILIR